jgi:hypothetical protein
MMGVSIAFQRSVLMRIRNYRIQRFLIAGALCLTALLSARSVSAKSETPIPHDTVVARDDAFAAENIPTSLLGGLLVVATCIPLFLLHRTVNKTKKEMQESAFFNEH